MQKTHATKTAKSSKKIQFFSTKVSAGFPSPAEGHVEARLDLNELLIPHPSSTFFVEVEGDSMVEAGIMNGDLLVIDRSLEAKNQSIILAVINNEFTVKRFVKNKQGVWLVPENKKYKPIPIQADVSFEVWGVVTSCIHRFQK